MSTATTPLPNYDQVKKIFFTDPPRLSFFNAILKISSSSSRLWEIARDVHFHPGKLTRARISDERILKIATEYRTALKNFMKDLHSQILPQGDNVKFEATWKDYRDKVSSYSIQVLDVIVRNFTSGIQALYPDAVPKSALEYQIIALWYGLDDKQKESGKLRILLETLLTSFEFVWSIALDSEWIRLCLFLALGLYLDPKVQNILEKYIIPGAYTRFVAYRGLRKLNLVNEAILLGNVDINDSLAMQFIGGMASMYQHTQTQTPLQIGSKLFTDISAPENRAIVPSDDAFRMAGFTVEVPAPPIMISSKLESNDDALSAEIAALILQDQEELETVNDDQIGEALAKAYRDLYGSKHAESPRPIVVSPPVVSSPPVVVVGEISGDRNNLDVF
jgi:hypothetical protein